LYQPQTGTQPALKVTGTFTPLGTPAYVEAKDDQDKDKRTESDKALSAAFRVRVSLPGGLGEALLAKVQALRSAPDPADVVKDEVGRVVAPPGGPGWPAREVFVTMRRIGKSDVIPTGPDKTGETGKFSNTYNEYES